jgi:hypothetical protein
LNISQIVWLEKYADGRIRDELILAHHLHQMWFCGKRIRDVLGDDPLLELGGGVDGIGGTYWGFLERRRV